MQITVFGANGKVGRLVVAGALECGYQVVAFVHSASSFDDHPNLKIAKGDIYNAVSVAQAVVGSQVVISALGSWGTPKKDILATGMAHIIPAMKANGISRIISLTGAAASAAGDKLTLADKISHRLLLLAASKILIDGEKHIQLLEQSGQDYTVIRSPIMNLRGDKLAYNLANKRPAPWQTINRQSVADAILGQVESTEHKKQAPFITRATV